jgi:hypothetical protein
MRKSIDQISSKARSVAGRCDHLRPFGKRVANKSSRRIVKAALKKAR